MTFTKEIPVSTTKALPVDVVCRCNHWSEEHDEASGECDAPNCTCQRSAASAKLNTPQAIADRGGEHQSRCRCAWCRVSA